MFSIFDEQRVKSQSMPAWSVWRAFRFAVGLLFAGASIAGSLRAQTTVPQFTVTTGTTTLDSALIATGGDLSDGNTYLPTIAGTTSAQRDALYVNGGATLALVSGADVTVKNDANLTAFLRVGYPDGGSGFLTIASGASLTVGQASRYANFEVGTGQASTGTVTQIGGDVRIYGSYNLGVDGGSGTYNMSGGTLTLSTGLYSLGLDRTTNSTTAQGTLNLSGTAQLTVLDGHFVIGDRDATGHQGSGVINQTGGTFTVGAGSGLFLAGAGDGTYNLAGGTLEVGGSDLIARYNSTTSHYTFNFGGSGTGATIRVVGSGLNTSVDANLVGGTIGTVSTIDTNGLDSTWAGNLVAGGLHQYGNNGNILIKTGAGALTLSGASRVLDSFGVTGGSIHQTAGATSSVEYMVGTGSGNTGAEVMDGGTLTINASTKADNTTAVAGSLRVGDFGGTGTFTQNAGTVTIAANGALNIGNQGGSGTYNLAGGTLNLGGGLNILGRSTSGNPASTGVLNISGGLLTVTNSSELIVGNNIEGAGVLFGTGVITQTGGTLSVADGTLHVGASGDGTYNLNGGTIQVAGGGLQGRYGSGAAQGASNFNLGGGTIQAVADMSTPIAATLTATTTSIFDTNGFNATWSGAIYGSGGLDKIGAGTLTFSGTTRTFGFFNAALGTTAQTAGATTSAEFVVGSGTGANGIFSLSGGTIAITGTPPFGGTASTLRIGDFGGTGVFNQTGGTVSVDGSLNIGNQGGSGTYNLSAGTLNLQTTGQSTLGRTSGSNPSYGGSTGAFNLSGTGVLNIGDTAKLVLSNWYPESGLTQGNGTLTQTGGTLAVGATAQLVLTGFGTGTYNLNGGTLQIGGSTSLQGVYGGESGTYHFNLGGGTIQVAGSDLATNVDATLTATTTSVFNTNGFNATWSGAFSGTGGLDKIGAGTLTFSGATRAFGFFNAAQGTTAQTAGATTSGEFVVGSGPGANGTFTLNGGTLGISGTPAFGGTSASLRIGDFGGTGVFTQTAGTVSVTGSLNIGNEGGTGTYNLSGGTLTLGSGLHDLGRTTVTTAASSGTLNLSGGLLELTTSTTRLILGDRNGEGLQGTGVLNQTGGILRVTAGDLWLSSRGNGTYNLNGGSLEVGGSGLQTFYQGTGSGTGTYTFNWGAGTIKVIGSDVTASANATLTATATLDTNSLNATWSGAFTGSGSLAKNGAGTLTLSGVNAYTGGTALDAGTLAISANANLGAAAGAVTFAGGTLRTTASLTAVRNTTLDTGGGTFDVASGTTLTWNGNISGASGDTLTKIGAGTLLLGGANTYSGDTLVSVGTLKLGAAGALSSNSKLNVASGASFDANGFAVTFSDLSGSGSLNVGSAGLTVAPSGQSTYSGTLGGSGGFAMSGTGTLTLGQANTYAGATTISAGTLQLGATGALPTGTAVALSTGATLDLNGHGATLGQLAGTGGTVALNGASLVVAQGGNSTFGGALTGTGGLTKSGTGTLALTGTSTYSGATSISGGELKLNGSAANSAFTVAGGTLSGSGTVGALTVSAGGILSPGNSPGTLSAGNTTFGSGGSMAWQINNAAPGGAGTQWDLLSVTGSLSLTATAASRFTLDLASLTSLDAAGLAANFDSSSDYSFTFLTTTGGITGFAADKFTIDTTHFENPFSGTWSVSSNGSNLSLNYTGAPAAVPEPSTYAFLAGGIALALALARNKFSAHRV